MAYELILKVLSNNYIVNIIIHNDTLFGAGDANTGIDFDILLRDLSSIDYNILN